VTLGKGEAQTRKNVINGEERRAKVEPADRFTAIPA